MFGYFTFQTTDGDPVTCHVNRQQIVGIRVSQTFNKEKYLITVFTTRKELDWVVAKATMKEVEEYLNTLTHEKRD